MALIDLEKAKAYNEQYKATGVAKPVQTQKTSGSSLMSMEKAIQHDAKAASEITAGERASSGVRSVLNTLVATPAMLYETVSGTAKAIPDYLKDKWSKDTLKRVGEDFRYILGDRDTPRTEVKNVEISDYGEINPNSFGMKRMDKAMELREDATKGLTGTKAFLADTAIGLGQYASTLPLAIANPAAGLGAMASVSAAQKAYDVAKAGGSATEAYARGAAAGTIEALTEALPLDNLIDLYKKGGKPALKNIIKQLGTEPTEETVSYVANYLADKNAGDDVEFSTKEMGLSALGGLVSAGVMSAGTSAAGRLLNSNKKTTLPTKDNAPETLPTTAQESVSTQESVVTPPEAKASQNEVIQPKEAVLTKQPEAPVKEVAPVEPPIAKPAVTEVDTTAPEEASVGAAPANFTGNAVHSFTNRNIATDTARHIDIQKEEQVNIHKYWRLANEATLNKAKAVMDTGLDNAVATLEQAIGKSQAGMKFAPEMVPLSKMVADSLAEQGKVAEADRLLASVAAELTEAGQLGQSAKILREASPSARIQTVTKIVDKLNEKVKPKKFNNRGNNIYVDSWMENVGKDLAKSLEKQGTVQTAKTVSQTILSDLKKFVSDANPETQRTSGRTQADRILDLFRNRENYEKAWSAAREKIEQAYADDPEALEAFDEWADTVLDMNSALTKQLTGQDQIVVDEALLTEYANATTDKERADALDKIYDKVAEQIPSTFMDQFNALRYLNMLGNLKTQVRNVSGNTTMTIIRTVKDKIKVGLEQIAKKASGGKYQPTAALVTDKATRKLAEQDWQAHRDEALGEAKYTTRNGIPSSIYDKVTVFKNNGTWGKTENSTLPMKAVRKGADLAKTGLEKYRVATKWAMEKGDEVFSKANYANALAGYLKANNISSEAFAKMLKDEQDGKGTSEALEKARNHAITEDQRATFRDQNQISDLFSEIGFKNPDTKAKKTANAIIQGTLPFRRTPANVMVRMFEYSPIGVLETTAKAVQAKKGNAEWSDVIDSLAANITGTGFFVLGMALQNAGKITGGEDEDEAQERLNDLVGEENYTVEIDGKNYTVDFLAPASVSMMMGAEFEKTREENGIDLGTALSVAATITNPILESSMLSGIRDAFDNVSYSENGMVSFATNALVDYLTQGLTSTLGGQIERTTQDERMSTFVDRNKDIGKETQYALGSASAKLPGYDYSQIPYIDAWGRTEKSKELPMRIAENFALPFYVSETNVTKADKEIQRLLDAGQSGVVPSKPSQSIKITYKKNPDDENEENKEKYLTADEYVTYSTVRGQTSYKVVSDLITLPEYKGLTDEEKADVIKKVYTYAGHLASEEVTGGKHDSDAYVHLAKSAQKELGLSESEYLLLTYKYPTLASKESIRKAYANGVSPWEYGEYAQNGEKRYDKDNSGGVDIKEREKAISSSGLSEEKQLALWKLAYPDWVEKAEEKGMPFDVYVKIKLGKY